ncbi:MAG: F0F1 ATP synthase subunit alpha [Anaerolineae bacterium]|jgi:F-type H+-transporting ATPase subunit alpha|nr:F0F1 ATP synthase subunit alpha [Anaerolineae bacterium]MDH7474231.1 F0F1 ATP synthase subunit alpha [Anaerolineae bacterium]
MDKPIPQPDTTLPRQALRQQTDQRVDRAGLVQRLSDDAASHLKILPVQPNIPLLLQLLREQASQLVAQVRFHDVGTVQRVGDGVATLSGLPGARTDELVVFPTGVQGMILNLDHDLIDVILLGPDEGIQGGDLVTASGERLRVPVGHNLPGRVVNPLGQPLDGRGPIDAADFRYLERDAPGIIERAPVHEPLHTGLKIVDALVPIGRGQRELIIGDRQTGKTSIAIDAIINQRGSGVLCVYVAIGQKKSSTLTVIETLRRHNALVYTIVVVSSPDDPPALRYLAPYAGCTMAEGLVYDGHDVLIVYDDLSKHADTYRELSLLLRRPPGREAYPGDVFYLHARLLERACKLSPEAGNGSLTALPIVETQRGNIAAYIPTNLISITDGQIVLDTELFNRGIKPAINVGQSVSRVGGAAQTAAMRAVARHLRLELAQFEEVARFARFGTEVDEATQRQIRRGERLRTVLKQPPQQPLSIAAQVIILLAAIEGFLDDIPPEDVPAFERGLLSRFQAEHPGLYHHIDRSGELDEKTREILLAMLAEYHATWSGGKVG